MSSLYIRRQIEPEAPKTWGLERPADVDINKITERLTRGTTITNHRHNEMKIYRRYQSPTRRTRAPETPPQQRAIAWGIKQNTAPVTVSARTEHTTRIIPDREHTNNVIPDRARTEHTTYVIPDRVREQSDSASVEEAQTPVASSGQQLPEVVEASRSEEEDLLRQQQQEQQQLQIMQLMQRRQQQERERIRRRLEGPTKSSRARSTQPPDEQQRPGRKQRMLPQRPHSSVHAKPSSAACSSAQSRSSSGTKREGTQLDFHRPTRAYSAKLQGYRAYHKTPKVIRQWDPANEKLLPDAEASSSESESDDELLRQIPTDDTPLAGSQLSHHVTRLSNATQASAHRSQPYQELVLCRRHLHARARIPLATALYEQDPSLPLLAGLPRTRATRDIAERNYRPHPRPHPACSACGVLVSQLYDPTRNV